MSARYGLSRSLAHRRPGRPSALADEDRALSKDAGLRHPERVSGPHLARRASPPRRSSVAPAVSRTAAVKPVAERVLGWQQQAGNHAVVRLLQRQARGAQGIEVGTVQRKVASHRENADITTLQPAGTLDEARWTAAFRAARATPTVAAYQALFRDIALTAGMDALGAGFVPSTIPVSDGKTAQPGLNLTLDTSGEPGHTGWVDKNGAFGVPTPRGPTGPPEVSIAIILTPQALAAEKGLSLRTARHEMVHAWHHAKVLAALKTWQALPVRGRPDFQAWLKQGTTRKKDPMSALDTALVGQGALDAKADTEVLGYVEGFTTDFHRRAATMDQAGPAFFELLGAAETDKLFTWVQASPAVRTEALTRLREYHATLDADHQRLWKEWLDGQLPKVQKNQPGRRQFLDALTAFVT